MQPELVFSRLGQAALRYAAKGWHVFPLVPGQKRPLVANGFKQATTNADQIAAWWRQHPEANIGCVPGPSGFVVIDLDGPDAEGEAEALGLLATPTLTSRTGRQDGGRHLWFLRPEGHIANGKLAPHIDTRGDAGYVVLPPSVHPTGALYSWADKSAPVALPDPVVPLVLGQETPAASDPTPARLRAAGIPLLERIGDGERTDALVRYTGRLLAKGVPVDEVHALMLGINASRFDPPLPEAKVRSTVASMADTHRRKHPERPLALVRDEYAPPAAPEPEPLPSPTELAAEQTEAARELLSRDLSRAVRWVWSEADTTFGPMLPADLIVLGALQGNGKTTLVRNQCDAWERQKISVLYLPLEVDPAVCRLQWAAARQNLNLPAAVRQEWSKLPAGAQDSLDMELEVLGKSRYLHFVPDKRVTLLTLKKWIEWGAKETDTRVVVVDHFHRLQFGGSAEAYRIAVTEAARQLKDLARDYGLTILATAQLNRSPDLLDAYQAPTISRIKESAGLAEEADVVLMASRQLKNDLPKNVEQQVRRGQLTELDVAERNTLRLTCRKHRLDDTARDRFVKLHVQDGIIRGLSTRSY